MAVVKSLEVNQAESPQTVYGRLLESVHIDGYTTARACSQLDWLLTDDRWKQCGFEDTEKFLHSINIGRFRLAIEDRKSLAKKLKDLEASQRAIGRVLGVNETTVRRDLGTRTAAKAAMIDGGAAETLDISAAPAAKAAPAPFQSDGAAAAKLVEKAVELPRKREERREERIQNLVEISKANATLGTDRTYPIIYADPPWRYENAPMGGDNRSIENHYPTMSLDEICALPVGDIATDNAMLYLWATAPKLAECMQVIEAWGFEYRTCMVWVKDKIGMGYHARSQHELLLIAKKGELPPPKEDARPSSVVVAKRTEHSAKPIEFYEIIERMYPELARRELFQRRPRPGWDGWGNQASSPHVA